MPRKISKNLSEHRISNKDLQNIVAEVYREKRSQDLNEGVISDIFKGLGDLFKSLFKVNAQEQRKATKNVVKEAKKTFDSAGMNADGLEDVAMAIEQELKNAADSYKSHVAKIEKYLDASDDKKVKDGAKAYSGQIVSMVFGDIIAVSEEKSDISKLVDELKKDANSKRGDDQNKEAKADGTEEKAEEGIATP
jgi:hypothetical protein